LSSPLVVLAQSPKLRCPPYFRLTDATKGHGSSGFARCFPSLPQFGDRDCFTFCDDRLGFFVSQRFAYHPPRFLFLPFYVVPWLFFVDGRPQSVKNPQPPANRFFGSFFSFPTFTLFPPSPEAWRPNPPTSCRFRFWREAFLATQFFFQMVTTGFLSLLSPYRA